MDEVIEFEFLVSHDELFAQVTWGDPGSAWRAFQQAEGVPSFAGVGFWILSGYVTGMYLGSLSPFAVHAPILGMTVTGAVGGAIGFLFARTRGRTKGASRDRVLRRIAAANTRAAMLGSLRVRFDQNGMTLELDRHVGSVGWDLIDRVYANPKHVFITTFKGEVLAIPRTAVGDEAEVERVVNTLRDMADRYGDPDFALRNYVRQFECVCPKCGYSLIGVTEIRCPECGHVPEECELVQQRGKPIAPSS